MKFVLLLLTLIFFAANIFCNDSILSKFHQHTFKIRDVRMDLTDYDKKFYNFFTFKAFKYNRTTTAHNTTVNVKVNMEDKMEVLVQAYKFLSNEYRHFPLRFQINLKKCIDSNMIGLGSIKNCGNLTTFYFHKNVTYHACNFVLDETRFPPLIPNGKYKVEVKILYLNQEISSLFILLEIYIPIYPKN